LAEARDADGATTRHEYDLVDRQLLSEGPEGTSIRQRYDAAGRATVREELLAGGGLADRWVRTRYGYDAFGRCGQVERDVAAGTTELWRLTFDRFGRPSRIDAPDGGVLTWRWDGDGRPLERVVDAGRPTARTEHWKWDGNGLLTESKTTLGRVVRLTYDEYDRPVRADFPDGTVQRVTWDRDDRPVRLEVLDAAGVVRSDERATFDPLGLPLEVAKRVIRADGTGSTLARARMTYDLCGRATGLADGLGRSSTWAWDADGRLSRQTDPVGTQISFSRTAAGRLTGLTVQLPGLPGQPAPPPSTWTVDQDALARITRVADPLGNTERYGYDTLDRLVEVQRADGVVETLRHDDQGHPLRRRWTRGSSSAEIRYDWDAGGRLRRLIGTCRRKSPGSG